jgi:hypothetical protein
MLADLKERQKAYPEAESLLKESLALHQKHQRPEEAEVAGAEFSLAALFVQIERLSEAEPLLVDSARIGERRLKDAPMPEEEAGYGWHLALTHFAAARIAPESERVSEARSRCRGAIELAEQWPDQHYMNSVRTGYDSLLRAH